MVTKELVDTLNNSLQDLEFAEQYRENVLSYARVLQEGRYTLPQYLDAVKFTSYLLMGDSRIVAYAKTFPDKYQNIIDAGSDPSPYCTAYSKGKLVAQIMEQSIVPSYVLNQDLHQKALNVMAELMVTARSEKVRSDAANNLANHLKVPEAQKIQLDIGIKENKTIEDLREATMALVKQQKEALASGMTAKDVAQSKLVIDGELED